MIFKKKRLYFEEEKKIESKDLWNVLKFLGLPNKISSCEVSALKVNNTVEHNADSVLEGCKD